MYLAYHQRALTYGISLMSIHPLTNNFSLWGSLQVGHSVSYCKQGSGGTVLTQTLWTWCCRVGAEHTCGLISLLIARVLQGRRKAQEKKAMDFCQISTWKTAVGVSVCLPPCLIETGSLCPFSAAVWSPFSLRKHQHGTRLYCVWLSWGCWVMGIHTLLLQFL